MNSLTSLLKSRLQSRLLSFRQSLLFYPIIFSSCALVLFLITSRIDELTYEKLTVDIPFLKSLVFAGSPNAARSILSTIAAGWATILGVAFSVTLITLQLATTKYTSHIVSRFEDDKINQLMLGWFVSVVLYSLLVLKTVRTGEETGIAFTPIIGVNVAVFIAIVALFVFVLFLHNISKYLRPNSLVSRLTAQILCSIKSYENRKPSENVLFERPPFGGDEKLFEIRSRTQGILRHIDWNVLSNSMRDLPQISNKTNLQMEWLKSLGDWIEKGSILAIVYGDKKKIITIPAAEEVNPSSYYKDKKKKEVRGKVSNLLSNFNNINSKDRNDTNHFHQNMLSALDISQDRDFARDPFYGVEILRSLAIKSVNQYDIDVVNSCITGLFRVLNDVFVSEEKIGIPFTFDLHTNDGNKKQVNKGGIEILGDITITINPKERKMTEMIASELSVIYEMAQSRHQTNTIKHFADEYTSLSRSLLDKNKVDEFKRLTEWYSNCILESSSEKNFQDQIVPLFSAFKEELNKNYPFATDIFTIYMRNSFAENKE